MALTKSVSTILSPVTVSADSVSSLSSVLDLASTVQLAITAECDYNATAPDDPAILEVFTSNDGTNFDSDAFKAASLPIRAGTKSRVTIDVPASPRYLAARIRNADETRAITNAKIVATRQNVS